MRPSKFLVCRTIIFFAFLCRTISDMDLQQRNEAFRDFLRSLNPAQTRAVMQTEGPVMVIAGPGTGKTHILTARIGKILLDTDAKAPNVLCLTFTDAGAHAMRQRLLERIGPEAWRIPIFTFHAFCNRIIQDNAEYFGRNNLEPVSELERIELVRGMIERLSPEHPLREGKKNVFQYENHLRDLFSSMKKEGWTPGHIIKKADQYLGELPSNPDFIYKTNTKHAKKGDLKTAQIEEVKSKMNRLKSGADLFPKYLLAMERAGRYEYEDMLLWVNRAFEKNEALLRGYQERYQYILVDEFQDTNGAQYHLLHQLLDFWEIPNIFIVGDDDQSIYEFQGARLNNLRDFYEQHRKGLEIVVLDQNYRSSQSMLDASMRLIANNQLRAIHLFDTPLSKDLKAQPLPENTFSEKVAVYENRLQETADIAHQIETLLKSGTPPQEIAVLYARHKQAERLITLLEKRGITTQVKRPINILDIPLVQQCRDLLRYLREESYRSFSGEHRLFRILHAAFWQLDTLDLARLAFLRTEKNKSTQSDHYGGGLGEAATYTDGGDDNSGKPLHLREKIAQVALLENLSIVHATKITRVSACVESWIAEVSNLSLVQLLERIYSQSGLLTWATQQSDKLWYLQVLHTFHAFVQEESARNPRFSLSNMLDLLDSMDDNKLTLPLKQPIQEGKGIQFFTAHAAKGLEFEHVFVIDCTEDAWEKNNTGSRGRFTLPPNLILSGEEDFIEARRRLFYVAMTRAKRHLYLSYSKMDEQGKTLSETRFLIESDIEKTAVKVPQDRLLLAQTTLLLEPDQPVITLPEPDFINQLLSQFTLSITGLNRYLRCPIAFYYEDILRIPGAMSEAAAFGVAMHGALQQFVLRMKADKKMQFPSQDGLQRIFTKELEAQRAYFTENAYVQRLALGKDYLRRIHVEQVGYWRKRVIVERRVDRVELDGVPMNGVLDKIEWLDNGTLRVVDYKTGIPNPQKTAAPDEKQPLGGDYWRQLAFYKILMDEARLYPEQVGKTAISWLEPDRKGSFPIHELTFTGTELQWMKDLIRDTWTKIQKRQFSIGCGKPDCTWCQMHRDRNMPELLIRDQEEGLDD